MSRTKKSKILGGLLARVWPSNQDRIWNEHPKNIQEDLAPVLLVGLGTQKSASTTLSNQMASHSEICAPPIHEVHYWDQIREAQNPLPKRNFKSRIARLRRSLTSSFVPESNFDDDNVVRFRHYVDHLRYSGLDDHAAYHRFTHLYRENQKIVFDNTPAYALCSKDVIQEIFNAHPNVLFVASFRDPVDRLWSSCKEATKRLAISKDGQLALARTLFSDALHNHSSAIWRRGEYKRIVSSLLDVAGQDKCLFLSFEDIVQNKAGSKVAQFLHIDEKKFGPPIPANVAPSFFGELDAEQADRASRALKHEYDFLKELFHDPRGF